MDVLGEGPVWDVQEQALYWVNIRGCAVRRFDWRTRKIDSWTLPEVVGSLAVRQSGGLLVALKSSLSFFDPATGALQRVSAPEADWPQMRFNDGKCDRQGRFWAGTMNDVTRDPEGTLYRLDPAHGCVAHADRHSDSQQPVLESGRPHHVLRGFPLAHDLRLPIRCGDRASWASGANSSPSRRPRFPTVPPSTRRASCGARTTTAGALSALRPTDSIDRAIELPVQRPTSVQFGGPDLDVLFITTATQKLSPEELGKQPLAGALLALEPGARGWRRPATLDEA